MFVFYRSKIMFTVILGCFIWPVHVFAAADYEREKRWANEVTPGLIIGEPIYLRQQSTHEFLTLYAEVDQPALAVIVVHGMGLHPDWGFIGTIRQELFDEGFSTLSIQMPVLAADASYKLYPALFPEAAERLQLAVKFLKDKGYKRIVIVSHSNGSRMSRVYMTAKPADVNAWVALSLTQQETFAGVNVPVFDLYGENDLPHVLSAAENRLNSFSNKEKSKQLMIPKADHFFNGYEDAMLNAVKEFLNNQK